MWNIRQFYVRDEKNSSFDIGKHRDSAMTGAVFVGHFSNLKNNLKDCRKALGVPVVFVDSHIKEPDVYSVVGPDITGALSATEFLIKQNIRRIGFLGAPSPNYFLRLKGYLQALKKHNITPDKKIIWFDREKAADDIERMTGRPAGIFCSGEQLAVRLMSRLNYSGVKIPDEISVICYDDTELLDLAYPPVSCVSVDIDGMASKTCLALTGRIKSKFIEVPAKLVIRESTKKSPGAESGKS
jgi:LacI family transcriptional regulator